MGGRIYRTQAARRVLVIVGQKKNTMISRGFIANRILLDSHEERYWTHLKLYNLAQATLAPSSGRSLPSCKWFLHVSAGAGHKVLLWSDGNPVACRMNSRGQGTIPPLDDGMLYTQVSAATVPQYFFEAMGMLWFVESMVVDNAAVWLPDQGIARLQLCHFAHTLCCN